MDVAVVQTATPMDGVGIGGLADYWSLAIRGVWFLAGFALVVVLGRFVIEPLLTKTVRRRNRNNPTIEEAVSRYFSLFVVAIAFFVAAAVAGYGRFIGDSALVIAAATLAIGVAAQSTVGSLVSGLTWSWIRSSTWETTSAGRTGKGPSNR